MNLLLALLKGQFDERQKNRMLNQLHFYYLNRERILNLKKLIPVKYCLSICRLLISFCLFSCSRHDV